MDSPLEVVESIDTFQDLHDALEQLENDLVAESNQSNEIKSSPSPTLGDLLQMKIT